MSSLNLLRERIVVSDPRRSTCMSLPIVSSSYREALYCSLLFSKTILLDRSSKIMKTFGSLEYVTVKTLIPLHPTLRGFLSQTSKVVRTATPLNIVIMRICLLYPSANVVRTAACCSGVSVSIVVREFEMSKSCDGVMILPSLDLA